MTAEILQFNKFGQAPRHTVWVCPGCGRMSLARLAEHAPIWTEDCRDAAVLVPIDDVLINSYTGRCIGVTGENGEKFEKIKVLYRAMCRRDSTSFFHL